MLHREHSAWKAHPARQPSCGFPMNRSKQSAVITYYPSYSGWNPQHSAHAQMWRHSQVAFDALTCGKWSSYMNISFRSQLEVIERRERYFSSSNRPSRGFDHHIVNLRTVLVSIIWMIEILRYHGCKRCIRFSCDRATVSRIRLGYLRNMILHQNTNAWSFSILPHHA